MKSSPFRRLISVLLAVGVISGASVPAGAEDSGDECEHIHTCVQWDGIYWQELCQDCGEQTGNGVRLGGPPEDAQNDSGAAEDDAAETGLEDHNEADNEASVDDETEAPLLTNEVCYFCENRIAAYQAGGDRAYMVFDVLDNLCHRVTVTCPDCGDYRTFDEDHRFQLARNAEQYDKEQHRTVKTCEACGYGLYEYDAHSWQYSSWETAGNGLYVRSKECSVCGLKRSETQSFDTEETNGVPDAWGQGGSNTESGQRGGYDCPEIPADSGGMTALPGISPTETPRPNYSVTGNGQLDNPYAADNRSESIYTWPEAGSSQTYNPDAGTRTVRQISVTVPEQMSLYVTEQGAVYSADSAKIINNTDSRVKVSSVTVKAAGGWTLAPYGLEMAMDEPAGRLIGFSLNGCATTRIGISETLSLTGDWTISGGGSLPLRYDAVMSLPSDLSTGEQVLTLVFVLDWV